MVKEVTLIQGPHDGVRLPCSALWLLVFHNGKMTVYNRQSVEQYSMQFFGYKLDEEPKCGEFVVLADRLGEPQELSEKAMIPEDVDAFAFENEDSLQPVG